MKFGMFFEHQVPRPWNDGDESRVFAEALEQIELADRIGIECAWVVEHHFLEEYSHSSAPELFLAAVSQRTKRIRLGHGIMHTIPAINHPVRVAERIATLDVLSGGRVEFGTGEGSAAAELDGFGVDPTHKRAMWEEGTRIALRCLTENPFTGYVGEHVRLAPRNVAPKPIQRPHPPVWVACTRRETIELAAEHGIGALSFAFSDRRQLVVGGVVSPHGIEAEELEGPGETAEVDVEHEPWLAQWSRTQSHERRHIERLEHRVHAHAVAVPHLVAEVHGLAVHQDHVDLGVRHPARLRQVLDRGASGHLECDEPAAPDRRQEVVQLGIEADVDAVAHLSRA